MTKSMYLCAVTCIMFLFVSCSLEDLFSDGRIEISTPEDGQKVNSRSISVRGKFTFTGDRDKDAEKDSSSDPFYVEVLVDGDIQETIGSSSDETGFNVTVALEEGENRITVIGYYLEDEVRELELYVTCDTTPPLVIISTYYPAPVTVDMLNINGTVTVNDLSTIEYKTTYVNRSDPQNPVTTETSYDALPYETSDSSDTLGAWSISYQNTATTQYADENSTGDLLTITIRAVDDIGNVGTHNKQFELFAPQHR